VDLGHARSERHPLALRSGRQVAMHSAFIIADVSSSHAASSTESPRSSASIRAQE